MISSTLERTRHELQGRIATVYPHEEARAIALRLMEEATGLSSSALLLSSKDSAILPAQRDQLEQYTSAILGGIPMQYALGYADFYGLRIGVAPGVLIPRPETEELVDLIVMRHRRYSHRRILDLCTGSACIPIALLWGLREHTIASATAVELSPEAIRIATDNISEARSSWGAEIELLSGDVLGDLVLTGMSYDIIVSNPPYILPDEAREMSPEVLEHEPRMALFALEEDPIAFYRAIARHAGIYGSSDAEVYSELNPLIAHDTLDAMCTVLGERVADARLIDDLSGKVRFAHITLRP